MDEFAQSMAVILTRMLAKAEMVEDCLKKKRLEIAMGDIDSLIRQIGQLIEAFEKEIRTG